MAATTAGCAPGPVPLEPFTPAEGDRAACRALVAHLPDTVADQPSRETRPRTSWAAAWGDPPIVLTCGGGPPSGFGRASSCTTVNGVDWYLPEEQLEAGRATDLTMTTVHREEYVEVRMPADYWPPATALADLSDVVAEHIPASGRCR